MKVHHIGIVIASEDEVSVWRDVFGLRQLCRDTVAAYDCECIFLADDAGHRLELILAAPGGGPRKLKPGLHHIAFETADVEADRVRFAERGMPLVEPAAVAGAFGLNINFLAPAYTRGVRVELVEQPAAWPPARCTGEVKG